MQKASKLNNLTEEQHDKIAQTIFTKFVRSHDDADYKSLFSEPVRKQLIKRVGEVVEALHLNGFEIVRKV